MLKKYYEKFKILMEPIKEAKKPAIILFSINLFLGFYSIFVIYLSANIIHAIEVKDIINFKLNLTILIIFTIIKLIVGFFDDGLFSLVNAGLENFLIKKYFKKYIYLDNNEVEKIGTGKTNSIVSKGIENWLNFISRVEFVIISIFSTVYILF